MNKLTKSQDYENLVEELGDLSSAANFDMGMKDLEWRHLFGKTILDSDFYKKHGKGGFVSTLASDIRKSQSFIYECMKFVEVYPKLSTLVETLDSGKVSIKWSDVRLKLIDSPKNCEHETEPEVLEITRERCVKCGKVVKETKVKK